MAATLQGKRIAFLAADGVEEVEYTKPREAVENAGAQVELVSIESGTIHDLPHRQPDAQSRAPASVLQLHALDRLAEADVVGEQILVPALGVLEGPVSPGQVRQVERR